MVVWILVLYFLCVCFNYRIACTTTEGTNAIKSAPARVWWQDLLAKAKLRLLTCSTNIFVVNVFILCFFIMIFFQICVWNQCFSEYFFWFQATVVAVLHTHVTRETFLFLLRQEFNKNAINVNDSLSFRLVINHHSWSVVILFSIFTSCDHIVSMN